MGPSKELTKLSARAAVKPFDTSRSCAPASVNVLSEAGAQDLLVSNGFTAARAESFVSSFDGPISVRQVQAGEQFLRYTGDPTSSGSFLTGSQFSTPAEAVKSLALEGYGNPATYVQNVTALRPSLVLEGRIAGGAEGITQTVVMDPGGFQF